MNPDRYPKDYKGPMSGISEAKEWMAVRGIDAFKWIQDGTWSYSDFDCWFSSRETTYYTLGEKNALLALEEFQRTMKMRNDERCS